MKNRYRTATIAVGSSFVLGLATSPGYAADNDFVTRCEGGTVVVNRTGNYAATQTDGPCNYVSVRIKLNSTRAWTSSKRASNGFVERTGANYKSAHTWSELSDGRGTAGSFQLPY